MNCKILLEKLQFQNVLQILQHWFQVKCLVACALWCKWWNRVV